MLPEQVLALRLAERHVLKNMRKPNFESNAFTLIELVLVVSIILILAAIAIPNFAKSKETTLDREAKANLNLIAAAEKIYKMENDLNAYGNCTTAANCNSLLRLTLDPKNWSYAVSGASTSAFKGKATRVTNASKCYQINQDGTITASCN